MAGPRLRRWTFGRLAFGGFCTPKSPTHLLLVSTLLPIPLFLPPEKEKSTEQRVTRTHQVCGGGGVYTCSHPKDIPLSTGRVHITSSNGQITKEPFFSSPKNISSANSSWRKSHTANCWPLKNKIHIEMDVFVIGKSYFLFFLISNKTIKPKKMSSTFLRLAAFLFLTDFFSKNRKLRIITPTCNLIKKNKFNQPFRSSETIKANQKLVHNWFQIKMYRENKKTCTEKGFNKLSLLLLFSFVWDSM